MGQQWPECVTLAKLLGREWPLCAECDRARRPSYFVDGDPKGCWVAHTVLAVYEAAALARVLGKLLNRLELRERLLEAAALHDAGKLTRQYVEGKCKFHNVLSAAIADAALRGLGRSDGDRRVVCLAVLLHHEARHWRALYEEPLALHVCDTWRSQQRFEVLDAEPTLAAAQELLDQLGLRGAAEALSRVPERGSVSRDWCTELLRRDPAVYRRSLPLYYLVRLADNRAASARETYWLWRLPTGASSPYEFTEALSSSGLRGLALTLSRVHALSGGGTPRRS